MKCRSVACIWSGTPPVHQVTATATLNYPPTLYTGGSDGSILWWNLSNSDSHSEIKPIAMLCGHAAPIADLGICCPAVVSGEPNTDYSSNVALNSFFDHDGALISACTDSMLCVWSRSSGHCRCRRKLPPWVGSPSIIRTLPWNQRYACVGCCLIDAAQLPDHHLMESAEGVEISVDKESQNRKRPKCTVVIVDTYTLTIVQTVFHGNLSIGPLRFMDVVSSVDGEKHFSLMADSFGKLQLVPLLKDSHQGGQDETGLQRNSSQQEIETWEEDFVEAGQVVSIATCRNIVATVLKDRSIFRQLGSAITIGVIFFMNNVLCIEGDYGQSHVAGGKFLENNSSGNAEIIGEAHEYENFLVWSNTGSAVVYAISYLNNTFNSEPLCEIPAAYYSLDARLSFSFVQLSQILLRIESVCFNVEDPFQWRPRVTFWSLHQKLDDHGKLFHVCRMLGEGISFLGWTSDESLGGCKIKLTSIQSSVSLSETMNRIHADDSCYSAPKGQIVSSSMVISENLYAPSAIVYGFFSGEIQVVWFNLFRALDSPAGSPRIEVDSHISKQIFAGHTGAILCLAAHRMVGAAKGWSFSQVLVSGSMDCTIHIWDLDSGNLITVMHQHVGPVRQIILPPTRTERPWSDCFLSVGEDSCIALTSLETLRVERMFPGHPNYPAKVVWDGARGYIASLCQHHSRISDITDVLYIWDVKTGARERVLRGTASHSMFDHFCQEISMTSISGSLLCGNTSVSSLLLPIHEDGSLSQYNLNNSESRATLSKMTGSSSSLGNINKVNSGKAVPITPFVFQTRKQPIKCFCPYPGIATLSFDLAAMLNPCQKHKPLAKDSDKRESSYTKQQGSEVFSPHHMISDDGFNTDWSSKDAIEEHEWIRSLEEYLVRFSLSFLHLWDVDCGLDELLITDMKLKRPNDFIVSSGLQGDKGSLTLTFPDFTATLELWKSSSEFCAMRSLTMVSLAQHMISLSHSSSAASSALAAFYTRNFADKFPDIKPPLLQLLVSFWQDESEHVRMAARSLFHCAASRAIPAPLYSQQATQHAKVLRSLTGIEESENEISRNEGTSIVGLNSQRLLETQGTSQVEEAKLLAWLESYEMQDWISCVGGTSQDAMTSHIIVAAALVIWYPSLVKPSLATIVVQPLVKLVMAMNEKYSSTAAELLAEGMESTWRACIGSEIPRLIGDIFFQIECVSSPSANSAGQKPVVPGSIRETLVGTLLPSLAMADILGFLTVIESQIWSTASDSPVHLVSLTTLIRVVHGSSRNLVQYLDKVVNFILQTMDPGNSVMRKTCLQRSMTALKEVIRVFPMVAMNESSTKLAFGDAIAEINSASIRVYDMQSVTRIKVLDASGPPGLPSLLLGAPETSVTTVISALSFSPDGEGLVAFSEHGLMIRWWSLGSVWWEKLSRNLAPVHCTKVIFIPPGEGFSPDTSRSSIMGSILGHDGEADSQETARTLCYADRLKLLIHNLDLSYRLEWIGERKVLLTRHGLEIGSFPL
ncbi:uncharacterized protein LOC111290469 [Durio zibethinus]|uniref:Uncharacterized protein LOC111290469 n=1 Tax=Durio zibethinus TaxID=66656 RepID=A0A6P5YB44_DURZI|nr:uncharacterized protein LOC111290469 [Durio zibethinus]